jgi:hypothetical protein
MSILRNERGVSLIGAMIAAAVGLVVTMGISKTLVNFSEQTQKTNRKQIMTQLSGNLNSLLRAKSKVWQPSLDKAGSCAYPGEKGKCPLELYRDADPEDNTSPIVQFTCKGDTFKEGVGFFASTGTLKAVNKNICKKCKKDKNCGLDPVKFIRFKVAYKNTPTTNLMPDFNGVIEDRGVSKHVQEIDTLSDSEGVVIYPDTFKCAAGQHIEGVNANGTPKCKATFENIDCSATGQILVGIRADGTPDCRTLTPPPAPTISLTNNCPSGQYMYNIVNNKPQCRTDKVGTTTTIVSSGGGSSSSGPSCSGSGTLPRDSYLHTSGGSSSNWGGCSNQGLSCGKSNGNSSKCCSGTAQWMYPNGCDSPPKCYCN